MTYLFPTELEARHFRVACPDAEIIICGVGMAAAAATMARIAPNTKEVILAGIAGCYDPTITPINSVVEVICEQIEELPEPFAKRYETAPQWGLPSAISNCVNRAGAPHQNAQIEDMEGASVMAICMALKIPFSQIRAISNIAGDPFSKWSIEPATKALAKTLKALR